MLTTLESSKRKTKPSVEPVLTNTLGSIVFVHGLTGHRDETWTATGADEPWPKSLLGKDIERARIITYGYDADVVHLTRPAGQNTVREHAQNLVNDLASLRRDSRIVNRPIIFVAHSLGGLVCQDALLLCNNPSEDAQRGILQSTRAIAFLGTPHAGADLAKFAAAVANIVACSMVKRPNRKLLGALKRNSEILTHIKQDFHTMLQRRLKDPSGLHPIDLHAFVEEVPVAFLGCVRLRRIVSRAWA